MDLSAISALSGLGGTLGLDSVSGLSTLTGSLSEKTGSADGTMFESILGAAMDNIKTTNSYLSDMENEEIRFALGETENAHDLTIALRKASSALQYTVAIKNKLLEAYKELMQMQI